MKMRLHILVFVGIRPAIYTVQNVLSIWLNLKVAGVACIHKCWDFTLGLWVVKQVWVAISAWWIKDL